MTESEAKFRTIIGAIVDDLDKDARLMEYTAARMTGVQQNCGAVADNLKRITKLLRHELANPPA